MVVVKKLQQEYESKMTVLLRIYYSCVTTQQSDNVLPCYNGQMQFF